MGWNSWMRQIHRWVSILFTAIFASILVAQAMGVKPPLWVYLSPLPELAILALTGLYLFALPYVLKRR